jgi:hypothetical protein
MEHPSMSGYLSSSAHIFSFQLSSEMFPVPTSLLGGMMANPLLVAAQSPDEVTCLGPPGIAQFSELVQ